MQPTNITAFTGFSNDTVTFYRQLVQHNDRLWFEAHKTEFKQHVLTPAQAFVAAMGDRLNSMTPRLIFDNRATGSGSIYRIYRDTRFSSDKTPYKTFLGILFWEGSRPKNENSGFYLQLNPDSLYLAVGLYIFPPALLKIYRDAVVHPELGPRLTTTVNEIAAAGYHVDGAHYKRVPAGYDAGHPNAALLRHNGLYAGLEIPIPDALYSEAFVEFCFAHFQAMLPLHQWLIRIFE